MIRVRTSGGLEAARVQTALDITIAVAAYCRDHDITQREFAARAGVGESALSHWRWGLNGMTLDSLIRVTDALGCDLALLPREDA